MFDSKLNLDINHVVKTVHFSVTLDILGFILSVIIITLDDPIHNQLTFLVRSFFFVFVRLIVNFGQIEYMIFEILATITIYYGITIVGR